jgi:predicted nucleotidyltransferase
MSPKTEILTKIRKHSQELKAYKVKRVGLFGSFAHLNQSPKSDIDILVEFDHGGKTFDNYMELKFYLERLFRRKVDLVIKDALKTRIKEKVLSEVKYA